LGLLGGIGAGKSTVARRTADLAPGDGQPCRVVDADALAREALEAAAADGRLAKSLGPEFVRDGRPDVKGLGARAFEDPALLRRLERLVHPPVHTAIKMAIRDFRANPGPSLLVLDVPLLIEVGLDRACDALWYVETPEELRTERAGRRGLNLQQMRLREAFQSPRERKRARADRIIRNDVDLDVLDEEIIAGLVALGVALPEERPAAVPAGGPEPGTSGCSDTESESADGRTIGNPTHP
jgi:dephospho-CoA kinase